MHPRSVRHTALAGILLIASATPAAAQYLTRPAREWESVETAHFRLHFPAEMRRWVVPVAERMESYAAAVNALVGNAPTARVTVMVEDPSNVSNGFAVPLLEGPVIFLWPTPPSPSPSFGQHRGWGEVLAVHEYGHIAHLTFPSRNPNERLLWRLLPARVGPVARKSPPWVIEGYATYLEGRLTGNGRPHSVGRAAVLRQWALEGRLPTYAQLDASTNYLGGAMRYLVGSAYLEWLAERKGDTSLTHLWRRMSARQRRSFAESFRGVYGAGPDDLYGAFFTDVMERALEARRQLQATGIREGELVQKLVWGTGEPALSRDGERVAVVLRTPSQPSRLVTWSARAAGGDSASAQERARRIARMLARDSLDVAPFDSFPPPRRALQVLYPVGGRGHENPRWFSDNARVLVSRDEPLGDGAMRPDLFVWDTRSGTVHRVTHGAGIRWGDPAPDGSRAAAVRCDAGTCDLVLVDLESGRWTRLAPGTPTVTWHRPRWSPDGKRIAASVQRDGRWWSYVVDAGTGETHRIDPGDSANRYAPSWTSDGRLVVVSERGGVANLELLDPDHPVPRTLTRVLGGVAAPDVGSGGDIWYLALHAKGYDVRRLPLAEAMANGSNPVVALDARLAPAAPEPLEVGMDFPAQAIADPHAYGVGPRAWRVLPGASLGPDGDMLSLMAANVDPVGRLSVVAQGGVGSRGAWRGGSLASALRVWPVQFEGSAWHVEQSPSRQAAGSLASGDIDARLSGAGLAARFQRDGGGWTYALRVGGSVSRLDASQLDGASRTMEFAEVRGGLEWNRRSLVVRPQLSAHVAQGRTGRDTWSRGWATVGFTLGGTPLPLRAEVTLGVTAPAAAGEGGRAFEQFAVGGGGTPFIDPAFLSQRITLPAVPVGYVSGRRLGLGKVSTAVLGLHPYAVWVAAGDELSRFQRVVGVEQEWRFPTIGFARLPATLVRFGVGYSMDAPYREKLRPYVGVMYRP